MAVEDGRCPKAGCGGAFLAKRCATGIVVECTRCRAVAVAKDLAAAKERLLQIQRKLDRIRSAMPDRRGQHPR